MNRKQRRAQKAGAPAGYEQCAQDMMRAALAFLRSRPGFTPRFNGFPAYIMAKVPAGIAEDEVALTAAIPDCLDWWPADAETRELLQVMEEAGKRQGTYLQAKHAIAMALENRGVAKA